MINAVQKLPLWFKFIIRFDFICNLLICTFKKKNIKRYYSRKIQWTLYLETRKESKKNVQYREIKSIELSKGLRSLLEKSLRSRVVEIDIWICYKSGVSLVLHSRLPFSYHRRLLSTVLSEVISLCIKSLKHDVTLPKNFATFFKSIIPPSLHNCH